jgi:hypothetical protein
MTEQTEQINTAPAPVRLLSIAERAAMSDKHARAVAEIEARAQAAERRQREVDQRILTAAVSFYADHDESAGRELKILQQARDGGEVRARMLAAGAARSAAAARPS